MRNKRILNFRCKDRAKRWHALLACWLCLVCVTPLAAQEKWDLRKDTDGIAVYTRNLAQAAVKEIKVICELPGTTAQLVNMLKDVERHQNWVYLNRKTQLLQKKNPNRLVYYTEADLPWPLTDRDMVVEAVFSPISQNQQARVEVRSVSGYVPEKEDFVRIPSSLAVWEISTVAKDRIKVVYTFSVNPGGSVPAWLVNATVATGPHKTFQNLRKLLQKQPNP
ncbi:START domain-containing protein [Rufibacter immobilis]|uniref:START domain-containing protein n=1 Tax=Rufibacter immobilis TaxID=1348778 RepID=UPI00161FF494|nr:START domain-containing protein [Rufibacter immobilis]